LPIFTEVVAYNMPIPKLEEDEEEIYNFGNESFDSEENNGWKE